MLALITSIHIRLSTGRHSGRPGSQSGQATAEYALVLLAAATIAVVLLVWATKSGAIEKLFDTVFNALMSKIA